MALFICREKCQWRERLWKENERMSFPSEHAHLVPDKFERVDNGPDAGRDANGGPTPSFEGDHQPNQARTRRGLDYDAREVAGIANMHYAKRNKLLASLKIEVPGKATYEDLARLIIDAARAKGIDPLPPELRAKINAEPVRPALVHKDDAPAPTVRMNSGYLADGRGQGQGHELGQGVSISDTL